MNKTKNKILQWIEIDAVIVIIACIYYFVLYQLNTTCLIKYFFDIKCPTCGMTRALLCLFKFDFNGYYGNHVLALPTILLIYLRLHIDKGRLFKIINFFLFFDTLFIIVIYFLRGFL